jgi:putative MATE family efflux protein
MNNKEYLGKENIGKLLFKLAIPSVIAQLVNMLYNIIDRIYIGHMPEVGSIALTGVGVCLPLILIVSAFAALVSSGGAPRASIKMGEKDYQGAEEILGNCFTLQIIISVFLTVLLLIFNRPLLLAFGGSSETIGYATSYMNIYAIGTIFVQLTLGMNGFISCQGFTKHSMISVAIGAVTNIILDPIFIYGLNMGVSGAALATIIAQGASTIWVLSFLRGKKTFIKLKPIYMKLKTNIIFPCILLGLATFIMQASESAIAICFNSSLQHYGGDLEVGTMTILTSVMQFAMMPMQGVAQGAQPIISYNFGAKNKTRVVKIFKLLLIVCLSYSIILCTSIMIFPKAFAGIFTDNQNLVEFASKMLRVYCAGIGIFGIQIACQMTFVSIGSSLSSIIVAVFRKCIVLIPLIYIVPLFLDNKILGVYLAEPIADISAVIFTTILFTFKFRKSLDSISVD